MVMIFLSMDSNIIGLRFSGGPFGLPGFCIMVLECLVSFLLGVHLSLLFCYKCLRLILNSRLLEIEFVTLA